MMLFDILVDISTDGLLAAVAGIGFGAISHPPKRAFPYIAFLAAIGHALRFCLMNYLQIDIATSSFFAALTIGMGSLSFGKLIYCPMTVLYIPALLPMIPGMYAYQSIFALVMLMQHLKEPALLGKYMQDMFINSTITISVVFLLAVGATAPIFIFQKRAYSLTRK
jgi:uncharacterized membrane protein YjjB (DUF3815 family)